MQVVSRQPKKRIKNKSVVRSDEQSVAEKIRWAWDDGCPVAASTGVEAAEMASVARRRWNSYGRRNKNIPDTIENRVNDLARGLAEKFTEGGWPMVGPLIADYVWLSEQIAPILMGGPGTTLGGAPTDSQ